MALIYIVEDDKSIREIETFALGNVGYDVKDFASAGEFYKTLDVRKPDLILLDIMLPDEDGLAIVKKLRKWEETRQLPIIMVTAKTTEIDKVKGLDMGADDYMTKPFGVMELISRVKALLRRSTKVQTEERVLQIGEIVLNRDKHTVSVKGKVCDLTYKEYELLKLLMKNAGIVATRETILDRVWGIDFEGESRTLDMHIKNLRQKLMEEGCRIKTVRNVGYIMDV
ncbi:MAG: response regulator transcription factor [Lachnospiraceae bacterium]|nr:response regulator transcription factor [Lachnospiraceae bacterium]